MRVQRTRFASLRSPLTRKPLGGRRSTLALVLLATISASCARPNLEVRLRELTGSGAVNCGHVSERRYMEANPCLVEAFSGKRPFFVRYDRAGIDSHVERAVVRTTDGRYLQVDFDSDVRGSGSWLFAKPRLAEQPCRPQLVQPVDYPKVFECAAPSPPEL
jgi:hypothetical protein